MQTLVAYVGVNPSSNAEIEIAKGRVNGTTRISGRRPLRSMSRG